MKAEFLNRSSAADKPKEVGAETEGEKSYPLLETEDADVVDETNEQPAPSADGYLEPVNRFPIPDRPITATNYNKRIMSNIRTNPHMRLTQV